MNSQLSEDHFHKVYKSYNTNSIRCDSILLLLI